MSEPLAELSASPMRRALGVGMLCALGVLLLWLGLGQSYGHFGYQVFMVALGGAVLYVGVRMYQATERRLILTEEGLFDSSGDQLTSFDNIRTAERGMLAFKPSNGFMITMKTRQPRRWQPGLYWIAGRRIGVGGVTPGSQAKFMADTINMQLAKRRGDL